ncbi:MAG TPA: TetR family transcriptional regulator [Actinomycetota bacterium]|jgi:AcrR family transcriptional regulator|nr:TetR family transcriptional regulator [Actinomycetota bacterium]
MSSTGPARRTGRRAGETRTREAILRAARRSFAARGYDGASIRAISSRAEVDPALVYHFFGSKERLFVEAVRFPVVPSDLLVDVLGSGRRRLGASIVRAVLGVWESPASRSQALALLRSAVTNERAAAMLRGFVTSTILRIVADAIGDEDAEYRASLVAGQVIGLGIARYVLRLEPLASASVEDLVAAIGPTLQRYLTGEVHA